MRPVETELDLIGVLFVDEPLELTQCFAREDDTAGQAFSALGDQTVDQC